LEGLAWFRLISLFPLTEALFYASYFGGLGVTLWVGTFLGWLLSVMKSSLFKGLISNSPGIECCSPTCSSTTATTEWTNLRIEARFLPDFIYVGIFGLLSKSTFMCAIPSAIFSRWEREEISAAFSRNWETSWANLFTCQFVKVMISGHSWKDEWRGVSRNAFTSLQSSWPVFNASWEGLLILSSSQKTARFIFEKGSASLALL